MPDRDVSTLNDMMHYQYAKIIACSAFGCIDGVEAKKKHYGFIKNTFRDLTSGRKTWSDIEREDWQLVESDKECVTKIETLGYPELGMEAVFMITVKNLPAFIIIDDKGNDFYDMLLHAPS